MIKFIKKLTNNLDVTAGNRLIVNAYVKTEHNQPVPSNWGDDINYHFLKYLTNKQIAIYFETPIAMRLKMKNYLFDVPEKVTMPKEAYLFNPSRRSRQFNIL